MLTLILVHRTRLNCWVSNPARHCMVELLHNAPTYNAELRKSLSSELTGTLHEEVTEPALGTIAEQDLLVVTVLSVYLEHM